MFKKNKQLIIGFLLGTMLFSIVPVGATIQEYLLKKSEVKVMVDGTEFANKELPVLIYKGYNYIPAATFREITDTLGVGFEYVGDKKEIQIDTKKIVEVKEEIKLEQERKVDNMDETVKDGYNLIVEDGIEYIGLFEIDKKYYDKGFAFKYNNESKLYSLEYNPQKSHPIDKYETMLENIECKIFKGHSYIEYKFFKENILQILNK